MGAAPIASLAVELSGLERLPPAARRPRLIARACRLALRRSRRRPRGGVSVAFLDRTTMRRVNKRHLAHDHDTDVLAFGYAGRAAGPRPPGAPAAEILVSAFLARRQAREMGHSVLAETLTLVAHGALHLAGLDDSTPRRREAMSRAQDRIVRRLIPGGGGAR